MNLSPTKLGMLSRCPHSFKLRYKQNLQPKMESANKQFGISIHTACEQAIVTKDSADPLDPMEVFMVAWGDYKDIEMSYPAKEDWESLNQKGKAMMEDFRDNYLWRFTNPYAVEGNVTFDIDKESTVYGRVDYAGGFLVDPETGEIGNVILDFKTSSSKYSDNKVRFNDQLTGYTMGSKVYPFDVDYLVLFVFVKTKKPYIQVIVEKKRDEEEIKDYMETARFHLENVLFKRYPKIKGDHCSWCDYGGLCSRQEGACQELVIRKQEFNTISGQYDVVLELYPGQYNHLGVIDDEEIVPMKYIREFVKEQDIPSIGIGFIVEKDYGDRSQEFGYWYKDGNISRVKKEGWIGWNVIEEEKETPEELESQEELQEVA